MSGNNGGGNNNNNKDVELEVFNRFSRIVRERFTALGGDNGDSARRLEGIDALYKVPEEKRVLNEMNNMGLHKGVLSGVVTFIFLRMSPRLLARALQQRAARAGMIDTTTSAAQQNLHNNPFHHHSSSATGGYKFDSTTGGGMQTNDRPGLFFQLLRLSLDTFVSLSIGAYASMYFIDKEKMMKSFSDIPLVEGGCVEFTKSSCFFRCASSSHIHFILLLM
jgi:hypothetical protein